MPELPEININKGHYIKQALDEIAEIKIELERLRKTKADKRTRRK